MTEPSTADASRIVWHDLMTVDLERSKEFYKGLFGWTTAQQEMGPMGSYTVIQHRGQTIGGMVATDPQHGLHTHWFSYLTFDDVDELCTRIGKVGGRVAVEPKGVRGVGRFAILHDPAGGVFSAIQMTGEMPGAGRSRDHGSFYWNQLLTRDSDRMAKFYGEICGWTVDEYEMGDLGYYGVFKRGDEAVAGMLPISDDDERKPGWVVYVAVDDIDESAEKAKELGGEIVSGPDIVHGVGKYAVVQDTTQGTFGLFKPAG
jgi:predicted enzyme related to lactoylglutathione lyase